MIPDYQTLMRPVLACAAAGETRIGDAVEQLADKLGLTPDERLQLLPSGKQTMFANRVHWAKTYLVKAGLAEGTRRGYFRITPRGQAVLADTTATINNAYLDQFKEFQDFKVKINEADGAAAATPAQVSAPFSAQVGTETPDEALRKAHGAITGALAADLLDRVRQATPAFFDGHVLSLGDDVQRKELKLYVAFKRLKDFATLVPQKHRLLLYLHVDPAQMVPLPANGRDVSQQAHWGTGDLELALTSQADLDAAKPLILMVYEGWAAFAASKPPPTSGS